jgi:hypothetical protein
MKTTLVAAAALLLSAGLSCAAQSPASVDAPAGSTLLLKAKGDGFQVYACTGGHWTLKAPDANLLDAQGNIIGKHFAGPTWHLNNGGEVKGKAIANQPAPDGVSVPWLLLQAVSSSGSLANVSYIRRVDTHGGTAPKEACTTVELRVPYTATYEFYTAK